MATTEDVSHPILKEPILYVVDPPKRVKWLHILEAFNSCGSITSLGKTPVDNQPNRKKWTILFPTLFQAEMALATLQGFEISGSTPPWAMVLSHSSTLESALPPSPLFPQFIKHNGTPLFMGNDTSPQTIFKWFRQAGPLVSVRAHVNVGYSSRAVVVQYWNEEHANKARIQKNALHAEMGRFPAFEMRTFDPCNLYCAGFGATFTHQNFLDAFSEFGQINKASLIKMGVPGGYGFISFMTRESATAALQAMNGKTVDGSTLIVRYHETKAQHIFRPWSSSNSGPPPNQQGSPRTSDPTASPDSSRAGPEPDEARQAREERQRREAAAREEQQRREEAAREEQQRREAAARELREAAERRAREAEAEAAKGKANAKTQEARQARREAAERAEMLARKNVEAARIDVDDADLELLIASEAKEAAENAVEDAKVVSAEAKRVWLEAMEKEAKAERQARDAREDIAHAEEKKRQAEVRQRIAEQEEISFREKKERIDRGEEVEVDEEQERLDDLAEKIKRMEELKKLEKEEKEARERREREMKKAEEERLARERKKREREEAERRRRDREEAERLAREQRQREEQARRQAENLKRLYRQAVNIEHARCLKRDLQYCGRGLDAVTWTTHHAYRRFVGVSEEFDTIKFHETTQPLTFHSIPWPVLHHPHRMSLDDIQGPAVNKFFAAVKAMQTQAEYMTLIKKARNRFHPDRWRSRGILASVLDENLRSQLEAAGNEVSKQINHLWDKRT